ncbi:hypothetical protein C482_16488 [Natrialba chahannaoensis JCM 10990]|uniref:Uncharacterized protein n=1 Tax=Natrialba chahannaoensis JCM 10990 TaxID=1227492 RepID=M0AA47_9EURY|nr:hypothetical protein C482_16488 [Natrialba chahannaoensis JCM 10990]
MSAHRFNARRAATDGRSIRRRSTVQSRSCVRSDSRSQSLDVCDAHETGDSQEPFDAATHSLKMKRVID